MKNKMYISMLISGLFILSVTSNIGISQLSGWEVFVNSRYGYTLEYPMEWRIQEWTTDNVPSPMTNNQRVKFVAPDGEYINVDVWEDVESFLEEWYQQYEAPSLTWIAPPELPNARIAGEEAFMTTDPSRMGIPAQVVVTFRKENCIVSNGFRNYLPVVLAGTISEAMGSRSLNWRQTEDTITQCIFQTQYIPTMGGTQVEVYRHLLETLEFGEEWTEDQIPKILASKMQMSSVKPQTDTCCGKTDLNGNPYSCGTGNGNCVWWANYMRPDLPSESLHNPHQWIRNISAQPYSCCFSVGTSPELGAIAVFDSNYCCGIGEEGHVGYVVSYTTYSVTVSQMNYYAKTCGPNVVAYPIQSGVNFIYGYPTLFEHADYRGAWSHYSTNDTDFFDDDFQYPTADRVRVGDKVSSIWIPDSWSALLFRHADYGCGSIGFECANRNLHTLTLSDGSPAGDSISSIIVGQHVCLYDQRCGAEYRPCTRLSTSVYVDDAKVVGQEAGGICSGTPPAPTPIIPTPISPPIPLPGDWQIRYYNDRNLGGGECNQGGLFGSYVFLDWGDDSPGGSCGPEFSARVERLMHFDEGDYTFRLFADDHAKLKVLGALGGDLVVDQWDATQHIETRHLYDGDYLVIVEYNDMGGRAMLGAWWTGPGFPSMPQESADERQWFGEYWGNRQQWENPVFKRNEGNALPLDHEWSYDGPGYGLPSERFSTRFSRTAYFDCGRYRFELDSDDYSELWLGPDADSPLLHFGGAFYQSREVDVPAGSYRLKVDHREESGAAHLWVNWTLLNPCPRPAPTSTPTNTPMPTSTNTPTPTSTRTVTPTSTPTPSGRAPVAPSNLSATALDSTRIRLNWHDNANNESGFRIYDGDMLVTTVGANVTTYTVGGLTPGSYHCYRIYAFNNYGSSAWTDWACTTTPSPTSTPTSTSTPMATPTGTPTATPSPTPMTGNVAPFASRSPDDVSAPNAFDGALSTFWVDGLGHKFNLVLSWSNPVMINRIIVWDRPQNSPDNNQINTLLVTLSNGMSKYFGMDSAGRRCIDISLSSPQIVDSVILSAADASGNNGLSEVEVWIGNKSGGPTCSNTGNMP